jgi:hypothetical protein
MKLSYIHSYPGVILKYMLPFRMKRTRQRNLPVGHIEKSYHRNILSLGSEFEVESAVTSPRISFDTQYYPDHYLFLQKR